MRFKWIVVDREGGEGMEMIRSGYRLNKEKVRAIVRETRHK